MAKVLEEMQRLSDRASVTTTLLLGIVAAVLQPSGASGQVIRGTVREDGTGRAVHRARIALLNQTNETLTTVYSEADGAFQIVAPGPGSFVVSIIRIGYRPVDERPVTLLPADTVDIAYYMQALPVPLDPVAVEAESYVRYLEESGFYRRQRMGFGYHVDPAWVEKQRDAAFEMADLMIRVPGVTAIQGSRPGTGRRVSIMGCGSPRYYVDDVKVIGKIDDWVLAFDVLAMEIFSRRTATPVRYGSGCVVLIWTRYKAERRSR